MSDVSDESAEKLHERLVRMAEEQAADLGDTDGHVFVVRTVTRLKAGGGGSGFEKNLDLSKTEDHVIKVGKFRTQPARVAISKHITINLGNFESAKVTVGYECPCYVEEMGEVDAALDELVERRIQEEILEVTGGADIRPGKDGVPAVAAATEATEAPKAAEAPA